MKNPWNLTPRQCQVVDALTRLGCNKLIARELGVKKVGSVSLTLFRACHRVGVKNRVQLALEWDRFTRAQA